jgi:hypothetical protein
MESNQELRESVFELNCTVLQLQADCDAKDQRIKDLDEQVRIQEVALAELSRVEDIKTITALESKIARVIEVGHDQDDVSTILARMLEILEAKE